MPDQLLPPELQEFLARHVDSIAQLEALLLLHGTAGKLWDVQATAQRLYIDEQEALETLDHLATHGFAARDATGYQFAPQSDELLRLVQLAVHHYKRHLIPMTNLIHAKPRRIRQFADAFRLRKD